MTNDIERAKERIDTFIFEIDKIMAVPDQFERIVSLIYMFGVSFLTKILKYFTFQIFNVKFINRNI